MRELKIKNPELVTVVIPCYNQAHFLVEAIESVLAQTYNDVEIIVVNDGSTDDTRRIAGGFSKVRLIEQKNLGVSAARNAGLGESRGEFLVFLDSDDRLYPDALEIGVSALRKRPECMFVSGACERIDSRGNFISVFEPQLKSDNYYESLLQNNHIAMPGSVVYRRAVFEKISGFDVTVNPTADYEIYMRIARQFPIFHHNQIVSEYRQHEKSMSSDSVLMLKSVLQVHGKQLKYIEKNKQYKSAWRYGRAFWLSLYGGGIARQVLSSVKNNQFRKALSDSVTFVRYPQMFPRVLSSYIRFKLT